MPNMIWFLKMAYKQDFHKQWVNQAQESTLAFENNHLAFVNLFREKSICM
jgi:phenolic acid decarboxylase